MTYTPNTPQATQTIAFTQPLIQGNFQYIQTTFAQKEHSFNGNSAAEVGAHLQCSMPNLGLTPSLRTGTNGVYFVNDGEAKFLCGDNMTICDLTSGTPGASGWQWLGRVLLQWGFTAYAQSGTTNFPTAFPNVCYMIQGTPTYNGLNPPNPAMVNDVAGLTIQNTNSDPLVGSFNWRFVTQSNRYTGFYWTAIGR